MLTTAWRVFLRRGNAVAALGAALALVGGGGVTALVWARPAAAPGPSRVSHGVVYADDAGPLLMDVYLPPRGGGPAGVPGVLVLHGGGWEGGGRSAMARESAALADAGMVAFDADYRLDGPGHPGFPGELGDATAAVGWIRAHAAQYGVDPARLGVLGASAGGTLALGLADVPGTVQAAVAWSAPTDLTSLADAAARGCAAHGCSRRSLSKYSLLYYAVRDYLGCLPAQCPGDYRAASPADTVRPGSAPAMLWNSSSELVPVGQADEYAAQARAVGTPVEVHVVRGHRHATQYASTALESSVRFLAGRLGAAAPRSQPAA